MLTKTSLLSASACAAALLLNTAVQAETQLPPPLAEEVSDIAVLPAPGPHRLLLAGAFGPAVGAQLREGETGKLIGTVSLGGLANIAFAPDQSKIYVAETIWTKGNRGTRQDMITVYDGRTLFIEKEIPLPGRVFMGPRRTNFSLSADGKQAYMYNFDPSASVNSVNLQDGSVTAIDIPGCAHAMAWGNTGFAVICADGSIGSVDTAQELALTRSTPFFDAENDPLFEEAAIDAAGQSGYFLSYTGQIHKVGLGPKPKAVESWPIQAAAGLELARPDDLQLAWRPGGSVIMAWHRATNRLFVLMHPGGHWTQKEAGEELWVVDLAKRKVTQRLPLEAPARSVAVSQDNDALLYLVSAEGALTVLNAADLSSKATVAKVGMVTPIVPVQ
ncbi:MAG TPA: amine dehydrogenase large subunit [Sphingomonadaceae bacterium]|nr:amine dehydrogenase large subunit [Sphingomonadaceae bacterium]